jgi:hydroxymethylglutaryl-CoA lyase
VQAISLADTIGGATPAVIYKIMAAVLGRGLPCEVGIHMHSTRATAETKILAAYNAGCRRFDSAIGGLGGCPFAQDELIGNIPTEEVIKALAQRGVSLPIEDTLAPVLDMNAAISREFATAQV